MLEDDSRSLVAGITSLALVLLLTLPSIFYVVSHLRDSKPKPDIYEDQDGVSTEKSMAEYSAKLPKFLLGIFAIAGLGTSICLAILDTLRDDSMFLENWLNVSQWVSPRDMVKLNADTFSF
jgi:hypothetical protein